MFVLTSTSANSREIEDAHIYQFSTYVLFGTPEERIEALKVLRKHAKPDVAATLILAMRYQGYGILIGDVLSELIGQKISSWNEAMLWQEANPQIVPHASFRTLKLRIFRSMDPNFSRKEQT